MSKTVIRSTFDHRFRLVIRMIGVLYLIFSPTFIIFSQEKESVPRISTSFGVTRFDIFHSVGFSRNFKRFQPEIAFSYGINRTIFQQRLFPKMSISTTYNFVQKEKIEVGPIVYYAFSVLKLNASSSKRNYWNEFYGGIEWNYGDKWKIGQQLTAGYFVENYFNTIHSKRLNVSNWGYYFNIKLTHEL